MKNYEIDESDESFEMRRQPPVIAEWVRIPDAIRMFGIKRTKLYDLIKAGAIRSACPRKRGCIRGCRIIFADSLRAFLEASAVEQEALRRGADAADRQEVYDERAP